MKVEEAIQFVQMQLPEERFKHTLRVAEEAVRLAKVYGSDPYQAELAAIFHDVAKNRPLAEMKRVILQSPLPKDLLQYHHELWHGPVGAIIVERDLGITDSEILHAIRFHTTGRAHMSQLEMIIFVADYIEPGRQFPGIDEVRQAAGKDLRYAAYLATRNTIQHLTRQQAKIYPDTFYAYNDLVDKLT